MLIKQPCLSHRNDLAVTPRIREGDTWRDGETSFFRVNAWQELAANAVAGSLAKGHRAVVIGRLRTRSWETQDGDKRWAVEIDAPDEAAPSLRWATAKPQVARGAAVGVIA